MTPAPDPRFRLVRSLESIAEAHRFQRKVVIARTFGEGSELLRALALHTDGWIGFEVSTPSRFATELLGADLAGDGLGILDEFGQAAVIDEAMDRVFSGGSWGPFHRLEEGVGFREAVAGAVSALRLAGLDAEAVRSSTLSDPRRKAFLEAILNEYEALLPERAVTDMAAVLKRAAHALGSESDLPRDTIVALVPGLSMRGLAGEFVSALQKVGARVLEGDGVGGVTVPPAYLWAAAKGGPLSGLFSARPTKRPLRAGMLEVFSASSVPDELMEVLRRAIADGLGWDSIEIVTPDPLTYGTTLHAICKRLGIPVSFGIGLPVERTRPGRAIHTYLRWIESGFPSDLLRGLLESGDLRAPSRHGGVSPVALARRLRKLRVGWGRSRYVPAIESVRRTVESEGAPWPHETVVEAEQRVERQLRELDALEAVIRRLDRFTPEIPDEGRASVREISPGDLARGVRAFLEMVPEGEGGDSVARQDLLLRLGRIIATLTRPTTLSAALSTLRRHLRIRVRAAWNEGSPPWKSTGGHVHLTDLVHGGLTGRRATFVVGLDAGRFPGHVFQDPILLDADRRALDAGLNTSRDELARRRFELAALASRVRGSLTLSYPAWDRSEARVVQPSPAVLQAFRFAHGLPEATYEDLQEHVGLPHGAVPRNGRHLDSQDVWMGALVEDGDGRLLDGETALRQAFPMVDAGLAAESARSENVAAPYHGLISVQAEHIDPRCNPDLIVSASRLEMLGKCPLRYFIRYGLGVRPPDDPTLDPDRWLDALQRGSLLHSVFDRSLREAREGGVEVTDPRFEALAIDLLDEEANSLLVRIPAPNRAVKGREVAELKEDVRSFAEILRQRGAPWTHLELAFGRRGLPPVHLPVGKTEVVVAGAIDRVDGLDEGLRVVDYKTGGTFTFSAESGVFDGGRRLQHVIYAAIAKKILGDAVQTVEYHFPTPRGENEVHAFSREELRGGLDLVATLLDQVAQGRFLPTDKPDDCRHCDFADVCRVRTDSGGVTSPLAEWGQRNREILPEYEQLKSARAWEAGT